ncbi:hypothetical protein [Pseudomonas chlororaphis]|uniref:hypothetical protein n=1 Tax=Pseudomonas chlororaphis TaxID=587753 RepID=UPI0005F93A23|nr:hypothetical protein [Pseudomonas chlororaphis]
MIDSKQFDALADLIRLRVGASQDAARLVLVEGLAPGEAARRVGATPQAVSNVLASCRKGLKLAQQVCGMPERTL